MSVSSNVNIGDILKVVDLVGSALQRYHAAYEEAKALAAKAGATEQDLRDADARYLRRYEDPLAGKPKPSEPSLYDAWVDDPGDEKLLEGDHVYGPNTDTGQVYINKGGPIKVGGLPGWPPPLIRVVHKG